MTLEEQKFLQALGLRLRQRREAQHLTQAQLGERCGLLRRKALGEQPILANGDVVLQDTRGFEKELQKRKPGDKVDLVLSRDGKIRKVTVTVGKKS